MEKESLSASMLKLILAISLIVGIGAVIGVLGYFLTMSKSEVVINIDVEKKVIKDEEMIQDETVDWKIYRNEEYGFEFEYPEKWIANKHEIISNKIYLASSDIVNKESGDTPNSMEIMIYKNINELDYKNIGLINLNDYLDKYSNISDPPIRNVEPFSVKSLSGYYADVRDFGGGKNYYIQTSNYIYVIRFSISEKVINQILSTFKFIEE
ncbi:MAG: hypothetical protein KAI71_00770 [Candidatus Pacebacteria bacterium]|nr:hypothetical protein [Candidatus Paceibacterota bacterium]